MHNVLTFDEFNPIRMYVIYNTEALIEKQKE